MSRLFISVERLEAWTAEGRATLHGAQMVLTENKQAFTMTPAVYFTKAIGASDGELELVGLVKSLRELSKMGADHMETSVICGETAYEVVNGFVGEPEVG